MRYWFINLRHNAKLSQRLLAKIVHCSPMMINYIESGSRRPSPELAQKLGKILNFDWTRFYTDN